MKTIIQITAAQRRAAMRTAAMHFREYTHPDATRCMTFSERMEQAAAYLGMATHYRDMAREWEKVPNFRA